MKSTLGKHRQRSGRSPTEKEVGLASFQVIDDWRAMLAGILSCSSLTSNVALVGLGNRFRGDDYIGSYIAKELIKRTKGNLPEGLYLFDAETNVESLILKLARIGLTHAVFIDACEMGAEPGETNLLSVNKTSYPFFTTHGIPLRVLAERLLSKSAVWVLAIQPKQAEFGDRLSPELRSSASAISGFITANLAEGGLTTAD